MDFIKEWTLMICITLVAAVMLSVLSPKSTMGRYFKLILAVFIFLSFIYPIKQKNLDIDFPEFNLVEYEDKQKTTYENIIENNVKSLLEDGGYEPIDVSCEISCRNEEIEIQSLKVSISDKLDKDDVRKYINKETGFNAEVYHLGE